MRHVISVLVENKFGVLARIAGLFSGRGFNIDTLNVGPTHEDGRSRITATLNGDEKALDQCVKQLDKLIDVIDVLDITPMDHIESELIMVKLRISKDCLNSIKTVFYDYSAEIINEKDGLTIIQLLAQPSKINEFLKSIEGLSELIAIARSGPLSIVKGDINLNL